MFDLEKALTDWQSALARGGCSADCIDELTDHLYCELGSDETGITEQVFTRALSAVGKAESLAIEFMNASMFNNEENIMASSVDTGSIALFSKQMATMLSAGVSLGESCELVAKATDDKQLRPLILALRNDLTQDKTFAESLRGHPEAFNPLYCDLIERAEQAELLDAMLSRLSTFIEKTEGLRQRVRRCRNYCIAMSVAMLTMLVAMVSPLGGVVVYISGMIVAFGAPMLIARSAGLSNRADHLLLGLPFVGPIGRDVALAAYARTLATTFVAGVPLMKALTSASATVGNSVFSDAIDGIRHRMTQNVRLNQAMSEAGVFPDLSVHMVALGEKAGTLDVMLDRLATFHEERCDNALLGLANLMQPTLIGILCVFVVLTSIG